MKLLVQQLVKVPIRDFVITNATVIIYLGPYLYSTLLNYKLA